MTPTDILILLTGFVIFVVVVGSIWRYVSGEIAWRKWNKENEI